VRGEIRYLGRVPDLGLGVFIGVALDEPLGNIDGSCNGVRYFETYPRYGIFLRKGQINVGDYPELDFEEF
jgi:dynactin complex subunit